MTSSGADSPPGLTARPHRWWELNVESLAPNSLRRTPDPGPLTRAPGSSASSPSHRVHTRFRQSGRDRPDTRARLTRSSTSAPDRWWHWWSPLAGSVTELPLYYSGHAPSPRMRPTASLECARTCGGHPVQHGRSAAGLLSATPLNGCPVQTPLVSSPSSKHLLEAERTQAL